MKRFILIIISLLFIIKISAENPSKGYRGFFDWSNSIRTSPSLLPHHRETMYFTGFSTSHGYQMNIPLFIGAGLDMEFYSRIQNNSNDIILAPYIIGRTDLRFGRFTPFADLKLGYNLSMGSGIYLSPEIGYRFNLSRKVGLNLGLGLTLCGYTSSLYNFEITPEGLLLETYIGKYHGINPYFSFRLGIDF